MRRAIVVVLALCVMLAPPIFATPTVPPWEKMPVAVTQGGTCGEGLPSIVIEARDPGDESPTYVGVFFLFDEDRPFAVYDPVTDMVFVDLDRDGIFERSGHPGEESVGGRPCDMAELAVKVKPVKP